MAIISTAWRYTMKNSITSCLRLPSARRFVFCLGVLLTVVFTFGDDLYASETGDVKEFSISSSYDQRYSSNYGRRYSRSILRGVRLRDVFTYNDTETTNFGPAYANVWTFKSNFLQCKPPAGRKFSYALCYYSGPDAPTGKNADNPSLPCTLSPDGVLANCTCYEISTDLISSKIPYFVDINAISNLEIYQQTVETCGKDGKKCADTDREPPVCDAINTNLLVPGADLISVFSAIYLPDYFSQGIDNSTECRKENSGIYAGCMTAPCYYTGEQDSAGRNLVECKCPVYNGPYQVGQANQNCNANELPPGATALRRQNGRVQGNNVWSAAFNPAGGAIEIPSDACVPDVPGDKGCGLFDPQQDYRIDPAGALCTKVCADYGASNGSNPNNPNIQVGYSCDATLCTTVGIGQEGNSLFPPPRSAQTGLLSKACSGIQDINGLTEIIQVEALAKCSCCASQVCGCKNINQLTNQAIVELNQQQRNVGIQPQCDLNGTLCGAHF